MKPIFCLLLAFLLISCSKKEQEIKQQQLSNGCFYNVSALTTIGDIFSSSGNTQIDRAVESDFVVLLQTFGLKVKLYYINEYNTPNAFFDRNAKGFDYPDGSIFMGIKLMNTKLLNSPDGGGGGVPFIIAHEIGHAKANKMGWQFRSPYSRTVKKDELFADFVAGTYLYDRPLFIYSNVNAAIQSFFNDGDNDFTSPMHHGTGQERVNALLAGRDYAIRYRNNTLDLAAYKKYADASGTIDLLYAGARTYLDTIWD